MIVVLKNVCCGMQAEAVLVLCCGAVRDLAPPGELTSPQMYPFEFTNVEMQYESYRGMQVRLRCGHFCASSSTCLGLCICQHFTPMGAAALARPARVMHWTRPYIRPKWLGALDRLITVPTAAFPHGIRCVHRGSSSCGNACPAAHVCSHPLDITVQM
jgi:hypothetical protein